MHRRLTKFQSGRKHTVLLRHSQSPHAKQRSGEYGRLDGGGAKRLPKQTINKLPSLFEQQHLIAESLLDLL